MQKKLVDYTNEVLDYIQNIPLSDSTVKYYRSCYKTLISYCKTNGYEFSEETAENFLKYEEHRYLQNEIGKIYYLHLGYRKDGSGDSNADQVVINSINVYQAEAKTKLILTFFN